MGVSSLLLLCCACYSSMQTWQKGASGGSCLPVVTHSAAPASGPTIGTVPECDEHALHDCACSDEEGGPQTEDEDEDDLDDQGELVRNRCCCARCAKGPAGVLHCALVPKYMGSIEVHASDGSTCLLPCHTPRCPLPILPTPRRPT